MSMPSETEGTGSCCSTGTLTIDNSDNSYYNQYVVSGRQTANTGFKLVATINENTLTRKRCFNFKVELQPDCTVDFIGAPPSQTALEFKELHVSDSEEMTIDHFTPVDTEDAQACPRTY